VGPARSAGVALTEAHNDGADHWRKLETPEPAVTALLRNQILASRLNPVRIPSVELNRLIVADAADMAYDDTPGWVLN
jgi:hypothetical protein